MECIFLILPDIQKRLIKVKKKRPLIQLKLFSITLMGKVLLIKSITAHHFTNIVFQDQAINTITAMIMVGNRSHLAA